MSHQDHSFKDAFRVKRGLEVIGGAILHGGIEVEGPANIPNITIDINEGRISSLSAMRIDNDPNSEYQSGSGTAFYPLSVIPETWFYDDVTLTQDVAINGTLNGVDVIVDSVNSNILAGNTLTIYTSSEMIGPISARDSMHVYGDLRVDGDVFFNANNSDGTNTINLGDDDTDNVVFRAVVDSDIIPSTNMTYDLGTVDKHWNNIYTHDLSAHGKVYWTSGSSDDVQQIATTLNSNSSNWNSTTNSVYGNSANWINTYTDVSTNSGNWDTAHGWGDHGAAGYWVDDATKRSNWDTAHGWGDHGAAGYLNVAGDTMTGALSVMNTTTIDNDLIVSGNSVIDGDLRVNGDVFFNANNSGGTNTINLGDDDTDNVVFNADVDSDIIPDQNMTYDLGTADKHWNNIYTHNLSAHGNLSATGNIHTHNLSANGDIDANGVVTWSGGDSNTVNTKLSEIAAASGDWDNTDWIHTNFVHTSGDTMTGDLTVHDINIAGVINKIDDVWTPVNATVNVSGWWDASDLNTLSLQNDNEVTQWSDKSGENNHLTVIDSLAVGPTTGRLLNGMNVLDWDNTTPAETGTVLERANFNWDQANIEMNVYAVIHFDDEGALNDQDFIFEGGSDTSNRLFSRVTGDGRLMVNGLTTSAGVITEGNTYIITLTINSNNSLIRVNGTQLVSGSANTKPMVELNIGGNIYEQQGLDGFIAEIVMTDDRTSTELIEGYLSHKWNIPLTAGHTYSLTAPTTTPSISYTSELVSTTPMSWPGGSTSRTNDVYTVVQSNSTVWSAGGSGGGSGGGGGVYVTDITCGGITTLSKDNTQVAVEGKTPVLSASVDDTDITFTLQWEGTSEYWTGYPEVSGWPVDKADTQAIGTNVRRYQGEVTLDLSAYSGTDVHIPYTYHGLEGVATVTIAGAGPEITDVTVTSAPSYQQTHYKNGDSITFEVTFNTTDVSSISLDGSGTATNTVTDQSVSLAGNVATITTTINTTATSITDLPIKISAKNSFGTEGSVYTTPAGKTVQCMYGPEVTAVSFGSYPNSQTELKDNDVITATFTFDTTNVTSVNLAGQGDNSLASKVETRGISTGGTTTGSNTITIDTTLASNSVQIYSRPIKVRAKGNGQPNYGNFYTSGSSEQVFVNNRKPTYTNINVSYPGSQEAISTGDSATVSITVSNQGAVPGNATYVYTDPTGAQLDIPDINTYGNKVVTMKSAYNSYNYGNTNFRLTVTRPENGGTSSKNVVVNVTAADPVLQVSVPNSRLRSGGTNGTTVKQYAVTVTSSQPLASFTMDETSNYGSLVAGTWSSSSNKQTWTNTIQVSDSDIKGTVPWININAQDRAARVKTSVNTGGTYVVGGYVSRNITMAVVSRYAALGTHVSNSSKVTATETFRGALTLSTKTNGATLDPDINSGDDEVGKFTIVDSGTPTIVDLSGDTIYYLDKAAVNSNTQGTSVMATQEVV